MIFLFPNNFSPSPSLCLVHHSQFQYRRLTKTNDKKQTYLDLHKLPITFHNRSPSTTYGNTLIPIILFTASATDPASFLASLSPTHNRSRKALDRLCTGVTTSSREKRARKGWRGEERRGGGKENSARRGLHTRVILSNVVRACR